MLCLGKGDTSSICIADNGDLRYVASDYGTKAVDVTLPMAAIPYQESATLMVDPRSRPMEDIPSPESL